jgi:cadmium resistance protein CadD (predicted permease)
MFWKTGITATIAFLATNLDDLILLIIFFAQAPQLWLQTIAGEYLGFLLILLCSLPGFWGGMCLPKPWVGLLGFLPIALGIRSWQSLQMRKRSLDHPPQASVISSMGTRQQLRIPGLHPQLILVALAAFLSGGDNIGVYVPLFASLDGTELGLTLLIFLGSMGLWSGLALYLVNHAAIAPIIGRHGDRLLPFVLIGLGFYILWENQSWQLIVPARI